MFYDTVKRTIDIVLGSLILVLFSPVMIVVAILVKLTSPGPLFYRPLRVGKGGRFFEMLKFRSMNMYEIDGKMVHAEKYLETDQKLLAKYQKNSFKLNKDPRTTKIGKLLRKFSLDELPQLLNVVKGDMSLVGPRAYQGDELNHQQKVYPHTQKYVKIILNSRPGASGTWQVSGRSQINFDKRVAMDADYVTKRSILYDLWVIVKTPFAMILAKGAI